MKEGNFYFVENRYFSDFPDSGLMTNKETIDGVDANRPCFYAFKDFKTGLYWMIPLSSKIEKYKKLYSEKIKKYGRCDTIVFGEMTGKERCFLIQNMCPTTEDYIKNVYLNPRTNKPIKLDSELEEFIVSKARFVLAMIRQGRKLIFPDVLEIERILLGR